MSGMSEVKVPWELLNDREVDPSLVEPRGERCPEHVGGDPPADARTSGIEADLVADALEIMDFIS